MDAAGSDASRSGRDQLWLSSRIPTAHGWTAVDKATLPDFKVVEDGFLGKTLRIEPKEWYALDYVLQAVSRVPRVTVIGKWTSDSWAYLRIRLVSTSGQNSITGWLQLNNAITVPREIGDQSKVSYEWSWPINLILENGWQRCTVDVEQAVAKTFGQTGWKYAHLEGFRVRGPIHLARIRLENV